MEKINTQPDDIAEVQTLKKKVSDLQEWIMDNELYEKPKLEKENQELKNKNEALSSESLTDSLTGLPNSRYFNKSIIETYSNPENINYHLNKMAIIYFDVDNLKTVNDKYGHIAGDKLIKKAASFLTSNFREGDIVIRLHGDEFVVVCHNSNLDNKFEDNVRQKLNELSKKANEVDINFYNEETEQKDPAPFGISSGMAIYYNGEEGSDIKKTVINAETAMRLAKIESKNKIKG